MLASAQSIYVDGCNKAGTAKPLLYLQLEREASWKVARRLERRREGGGRSAICLRHEFCVASCRLALPSRVLIQEKQIAVPGGAIHSFALGREGSHQLTGDLLVMTAGSDQTHATNTNLQWQQSEYVAS